MQINFHHNRSFEIINNGETLQFYETEELSFTFVEYLSQFRLEDGDFSFSFPFDMIEVFFDYKADGTVIIGTVMYDGTEKQELILTASDFFTTFCQALFDYFKRIEENMPLEKYVLDNNLQRNKNRKWKWEIFEELKKNLSNLD
jgi:hypothetical protein